MTGTPGKSSPEAPGQDFRPGKIPSFVSGNLAPISGEEEVHLDSVKGGERENPAPGQKNNRIPETGLYKDHGIADLLLLRKSVGGGVTAGNSVESGQ